MLVLAVIILLAQSALAVSRTCTDLTDPASIDRSMRLCADNYHPHDYPEGVRITADNIVLDCGSAVLHGKFKNSGIVLKDRNKVTIKNCQVANYETGILIKNSHNITILETSLIHNYLGIKLLDSTGVTVEHSHDISIKKPVQIINSYGNSFHFTNKDLEGELCRLNQCNTPAGPGEQEQLLAQEEAPRKFLRRILMDNIRKWLAA